MSTITNFARATIRAAAIDVYDFVATPSHWETTHPVTDKVWGIATDRPASRGDTWTERISTPARGRALDATWTVTEAEPGRRWTIRTENYDGRPVSITITYAFDEVSGSTVFERSMTTDDPADTLPETERAIFASPATHEAYLEAVRVHFEQSAD
jgi:hypothetical protein